MSHRCSALVAVGSALVMALAACGGSSATPTAAQSAAPVYTLGVLTDLTGPAASTSATLVQGVRAGISVAAKDGYHLRYVVADTATSPDGALTAAKKLVQQDHVFAVVANSVLTFAAAGFLTAQGIPVLGSAQDGAEWITSRNMFSSFGRADTTKVATTVGTFLKTKGVTSSAGVSYDLPLAAQSAAGATISAQNAGIKVGYLNTKFPLLSSDVQPVALAMRSAGVDGLTAAVSSNVALSLVTALRQLNVGIKVALLATGYGGDLLQAGPGALQGAQGLYFYLAFQPIEMHTAATKRFEQALRDVGVTGDPTFAEYSGYTSLALLMTGLRAAGPNPTRSTFIDALSRVKDFDALGLLGSHKLDLSLNNGSVVFGPGNCVYITQLVGSSFRLVAGADPICGTVIPGKTVSGS